MTATIGCDVGQVRDATAIIVVESFRPDPEPPRLEYQDLRHIVHWCQKVPLGTSYVDVVQQITATAERARSLGHVMLVVDATGVGRPLCDLLRREARVSMRTVTFTSGESETRDGSFGFHTPKRDLMGALLLVIESRRITVLPSCPFRADLLAELQNIDFTISERTGHDSYAAAGSGHDDMTMALALAIWWAERPDAGAAYAEAQRQRAARTPMERQAAIDRWTRHSWREGW